MTDFHTSKTVGKTRKKHECEQCGRTIDVGSPAIYGFGRYDGDLFSTYQHIECHAAGVAYADMTGLWGDEFTWFQHDDCLRERDGSGTWLLENHPIVAERMGLSKADFAVDEDITQ